MRAARRLKEISRPNERPGRIDVEEEDPGPSDKDYLNHLEKKKAPSSPKRMMRALAKGGKKSFPDLSGDKGKVTKKDILMGRGVIKK